MTVPLWPKAEFEDHSVIMIEFVVIVFEFVDNILFTTHSNHYFIRPYEVAFLLKHKNLLALLKLMIKEIKEIRKKESLSVTDFINFVCSSKFLSQFPDWGEGGTSNIKGCSSQEYVGLWLEFALLEFTRIY